MRHNSQLNGENHEIRLDSDNTTVAFSVRWLGAITVRGRFSEVEGSLRIPDGSVDHAHIEVRVASRSLSTGIALRDRHLRGPQFLDVERYPAISFKSRRIERPNGIIVVAGSLDLRGLEREVLATCPVDWANGTGLRSLVRVSATLVVSRLPHRIGVAEGFDRLNPLLYAIGTDVTVTADIMVPASKLLPALLPALGP